MARKTYGSDLTDKQWKLIEPHIPPEKDFGRPRTTNMREITNALLYRGYPKSMRRSLNPPVMVNNESLYISNKPHDCGVRKFMWQQFKQIAATSNSCFNTMLIIL